MEKKIHAHINLGLKLPTGSTAYLYNDKDIPMGLITTYKHLLAVRLHIMENKLSDWYLMFAEQKINISSNGDLDKWPKGFFEQELTLTRKLLKIRLSHNAKSSVADKFVKVLDAMDLKEGDRISPIKFFTKAQELEVLSPEQFVDIDKAKQYLDLLEKEGHVEKIEKTYFKL